MVNTDERARLLDETLARRVPNPDQWARFKRSFDGPSAGSEVWVEYPPLDQLQGQHLVVLLRRDGDVQVEWHVSGERGSPFELSMPCDVQPLNEVIDEAAKFVADVLSENIILAYHDGLFRGGRRFLRTVEVADARRDRHIV